MKLEKQDDDELEMLLDEIPHATSISLHHQQLHVHSNHSHGHDEDIMSRQVDGYKYTSKDSIHGLYDDDASWHGYVCASSPFSGISSSSSSSADGPGSPLLPSVESQIPTKKSHFPNGLWNAAESELFEKSLSDELDLMDKLRKMQIEEKIQPTVAFDRVTINRGNVGVNSPFGACKNGFSNDFGGFGFVGMPNSTLLDEERRPSMMGMHQQYHMSNVAGSHRSSSPFAFPGQYINQVDFPWKQSREYSRPEAAFGSNGFYRDSWMPQIVPSINRISVPGGFFQSQQNGIDFSGDWSSMNSVSSPNLALPKMPPGSGNLLHYSLPMVNDRGKVSTNGWAPQSPSMRSVQNLEAFACEDSLIIQGKDFNFVINGRCNPSREHRRNSRDDIGRGHSVERNFAGEAATGSQTVCSPRVFCPSFLPPKYNSLMEVKGYIYFVAKDQHGCRFLQRKFDEGTPQDVQMIFNEIVDHVVELMMNPFGNYLMQKLLDVCTEEQRMKILYVVTEQPGQLVRISLNTHGTRAVQKLIDTLKTRQQTSLVVSALEPGFLQLIKDLNGNHVVQRCLQCLSNEDNKFIFDAAAKNCVEIATHRHGCCVLQRCIGHSTGEHRANLVAEISSNGLHLAQDAFGNYVIQYILEMKIPSATANLIAQFEGNYVHLSTQKFSSNVVEKCLKEFGEESRSRIIHELLSTSHFEQLLQDPFANYVIQSALLLSKGPLHASLVEAIRPHAAVLRTSPYCKRIFSRNLLRK